MPALAALALILLALAFGVAVGAAWGRSAPAPPRAVSDWMRFKARGWRRLSDDFSADGDAHSALVARKNSEIWGFIADRLDEEFSA